jgi:hypothetical protein
MRLHADRRRGFALAVALAALVVIGGLIAGAFFASTQHYRIGRNSIQQQRALAAAEYGLYDAMRKGVWNSAWLDVSSGVVREPQPVTLPDGSQYAVTITALGNGTFQITSEGSAGAPLVASARARRRVGALIALDKVSFAPPGALTTQGTTKIGVALDGKNVNPPGIDCKDPATGGVRGIAIDKPNDNIKLAGGSIAGVPDAILEIPSANNDDAVFKKFGDFDWQRLTSAADIKFTSAVGPKISPRPRDVTKNGQLTCDFTDQFNWGDPKHNYADSKSCYDYYPIIYVKGDLQMSGGVGQGILLIEGTLQAEGGFEFYGPVIAQGGVEITGNANFYGGVIARNFIGDKNQQINGNAVVQYSTCAIKKAVNASAIPRLASGRSWAELY